MLIAVVAMAGVLVGCEHEQMSAGEGEPGEQYMYTVKGDEGGFYGVAEKVYGDGDMWPHIADANPDLKTDDLEAGDKLMIPTVQSEGGEMITPMGCDRQRIY
jgi:hypothetical protein